jgi:hypothetical protein
VTRNSAPVLALVLALALAGCSGASDEEGGRDGAAPSTSTSASPAPTGTTAGPADPRPLAAFCQDLGVAARNQSVSAALAVTGDEKGAAMRATVAQSYSQFGRLLAAMALQGPTALVPALADWAAASHEVARFVARTTPGPGIVLDVGPGHTRWQAAQKAAEKVCGHPLPDTGS